MSRTLPLITAALLMLIEPAAAIALAEAAELPEVDQPELDEVPEEPSTVWILAGASIIALASVGFIVHLAGKIRRSL